MKPPQVWICIVKKQQKNQQPTIEDNETEQETLVITQIKHHNIQCYFENTIFAKVLVEFGSLSIKWLICDFSIGVA